MYRCTMYMHLSYRCFQCLVPVLRVVGGYNECLSNSLFLFFPAFFVYKLVMSLREKQRAKEEKKKLKMQRKEKEAARKQKKR